VLTIERPLILSICLLCWCTGNRILFVLYIHYPLYLCWYLSLHAQQEVWLLWPPSNHNIHWLHCIHCHVWNGLPRLEVLEPLPLSSVEHYNLVFRFVLSRTGSLVSYAHYVAIKQLLAKCLSMRHEVAVCNANQHFCISGLQTSACKR